ncbi:pyridoxal phosphate-dependent aminotransferase [Streptomyces violaceusniger]|uniref:pyridoxal phosphate-dependent aminotransferase n=1 Tax=Streptomyces violaceusniger TaxID=68280 RepID=UPI000996F244|nr:pyridoxal phosphate-dependent aminotransferase [Streptomyces hygroscopicus]AQW49527.1 aspartate aminotransferase [Streptomyces hygroscopicus]
MSPAFDLAQPAARLADIKPSPIRAIFDRASELERTGERVIHLEIGRPDFDTPGVAKQRAAQAIADGKVHYGPNAGQPELRAAISRYLERRHNLTYSPDDEVLVTIGANEAVFLAIMAFCGPGDEVVIPVPAWSAYVACVRLAGATPVILPLDADDGYQVDSDALAAVMTERTRMVVLCTPHNPTGAVTEPKRLAGVADVLRGTRSLLLSDEIYAELVYDGHHHISPASVADLRHRTLVVGGFAKAYAMDGWRLGWLAGPAELVRPALRIRQFTTICPTTFAQLGGAAALDEAGVERDSMRQEFGRRRDAALEVLAGQDVLSPGLPGGAFYMYLSYPERLGPSDELAWRLLEEQHVAVVPGTAFDADGGKHALRISYACGIDDVREGLNRVVAMARGN